MNRNGRDRSLDQSLKRSERFEIQKINPEINLDYLIFRNQHSQPKTKFILEELFNLVKEVTNQDAETNATIPKGQNDAFVAEATNTVASGMRNLVSGGGLGSLLSMFSDSKGFSKAGGGLLSNPIVSMMVGHFAEKLMSKFGLGSKQAGKVSSSVIPNVLKDLINKTNDPDNNSFSLDKILNSITGGKVSEVAPQTESSGGGLSDILGQLTGGHNSGSGGGLGDILGQLTGGQSSGGGGGLGDILGQLTGGGNAGGGGIGDILSKIAGGAQEQQQRNGGGGLMDLIKGFIK